MRNPARLALAAAAGAAGALSLASKYGLGVTVYEPAYGRLPDAFDGFHIVHLSDLHCARFGRDNSRLVSAVAALEPDLIALTGDFLDRNAPKELPAISALCSALVRIAPVFFVSGNHDWSSGGMDELPGALGRAGVRCLRGEYVPLTRDGGRIIVCGAEDTSAGPGTARPDALVAELRREYPEDFVLLLGHRNHWHARYPALDVDLVLCGHAHGGIIRLPGLGGLLGNDARFFPKYDAGLYRGQYDMIVSRGLGNSVPIPRFLNIPEIVSVRLRKK